MPPTSIFPLFLTKKGPTVKAVQEVLQSIGEASAGTKDVVQNRLLTKVVSRKLPQFNRPHGQSPRILSIDMGIRNLAYCVADVEKSASTRNNANMNFLTWRRFDLSEAFREYDMNLPGEGVEAKAVLQRQEDEDLYTPENLSRMGYWFLRKVLDDWNPDVILIERQRWRSAGSPTIQQWTVRVNSLEAIMWAVMTALKAERNKNAEWRMYAVDPKRVGHYWLNGVTATQLPPEPSKKKRSKSTAKSEGDAGIVEELDEEEVVPSTKKLTRSKAEKKAKIQLLRTWLDSAHPSTTPRSSASKTSESETPYPNMSFSFSQHGRSDSLRYGADGTRQALLYATDKLSERAQRTGYYQAYVKKVDDITDCFLQAAAWVAWDEELRRLGPEVEELRARVEEQLGRKVEGGLADGVQEIQTGTRGGGDAGEMKPVTKKAAMKNRKAKAEGMKSLLEEEEPRVLPKTKRKGRKSMK